MICVAGADGFFGTYIQQHIPASSGTQSVLCLNHGKEDNVYSPSFFNLHFDLKDKKSIYKAAEALSGFDDIRILFLASVHNPDIVKKAPEEAEYINTVCYEAFLDAIKGADIKKLIYASSDTVYGESKNGYIFSETDLTCPINIYGEQKLMAEKITQSYGYTTARYSYMYGPSLTHRKRHFYDEICQKLKNGEKIYMLTDWVRNAITYKKAAEITYKLLLSDKNVNIVNICGNTPLSKYDIGLEAARHIGADPSLVIPCTSDELDIFTEKRANEILMSNSLLDSTDF